MGPPEHHRADPRPDRRAVVFDLLENASVLALLANYPKRMNVLAASLPYTTLVKRAASLLALGIPLAMLSFEFMRRKQLLGVRRP